MDEWRPGTRVRWFPYHADYPHPSRGVIADAPAWPPLDRLLRPAPRLPVDLDPPVTIGGIDVPAQGARPHLITRLYVEASMLQHDEEPA